MASKATAVDIGSHSAKVLVAQVGKHGVSVLRFAGLPAAEGNVSLAEAGIPLKDATCGLAGRDMTLRYSQVPPTPDWQLRNLMDLEIQDLAQQSGGALSADYNLLPIEDESGSDTVLLALAKDDALERLQGEVAGGGVAVTAYVPNCTALYNAYLKCGPVDADAVVALVNIGHETIDLAIVKGTDLLFARNLTSGTKVLDEAIAMAKRQKRNALAKDWMALKKRGLTSPTRGAVGGVAFSVAEVEAFSTDIYQFDFIGAEPARVCMVGNGETTLGLYAYDADGNRLDSARADRGGVCVAWTPRDTAKFGTLDSNTYSDLSEAINALDSATAYMAQSPRREKDALAAVMDAMGMAGGFLLALFSLGAIREILGDGALFGVSLFGENFEPWIIMILPPGGFLTLGVILLFFNWFKFKKDEFLAEVAEAERSGR